MGCCASNLKMDMQRSLDGSIYASKRSRSGSNSSNGSGSASVASGSPNGSAVNSNSSGLGSACSTPQRSSNRSIWSRSANQSRPIPICDDFAEQPTQVLDRSCGYHTCSTSTSSSSSVCSTPSKRQLRCTQEMDNYNSQNISCEEEEAEVPAVGNLEWEMHMMQQAQPIMCKTSSPLCQRRLQSPPVGGSRQQQLQHDPNSRSYHKWRNYLQCTPVHMLHNVSHIPEAIAGQFCPIDFPAFSDLEEMESAAKRYKVDRGHHQEHESRDYQQLRMQQQLTHTISTDL
ncbi:hypothetical protein KR215_009153 [Drosophila sulfurigaster]|nr:hypothetical protein KR215_009153 [Drosophila sulfurigaster]